MAEIYVYTDFDSDSDAHASYALVTAGGMGVYINNLGFAELPDEMVGQPATISRPGFFNINIDYLVSDSDSYKLEPDNKYFTIEDIGNFVKICDHYYKSDNKQYENQGNADYYGYYDEDCFLVQHVCVDSESDLIIITDPKSLFRGCDILPLDKFPYCEFYFQNTSRLLNIAGTGQNDIYLCTDGSSGDDEDYKLEVASYPSWVTKVALGGDLTIRQTDIYVDVSPNTTTSPREDYIYFNMVSTGSTKCFVRREYLRVTQQAGTSPGYYTVTPKVSGASYGFASGSTYWYSTNNGVNNSAAVCQVDFHLDYALDVQFYVINYAEAGYDYGIIGSKNQTLSTGNTIDSGTVWDGRIKNKSTEQLVTVSLPAGYSFIQLKYRKDVSTHSYNDNFQFRIANVQPRITDITFYGGTLSDWERSDEAYVDVPIYNYGPTTVFGIYVTSKSGNDIIISNDEYGSDWEGYLDIRNNDGYSFCEGVTHYSGNFLEILITPTGAMVDDSYTVEFTFDTGIGVTIKKYLNIEIIEAQYS